MIKKEVEKQILFAICMEIDVIKDKQVKVEENEIYEKKKISIREIVSRIANNIMMIIICIITFFPFIWMMISSLKTSDEIFTFPPAILPNEFMWSNFSDVFNEVPFEIYLKNSFTVASIEVAAQLITAAMIGYALTQFKFKGRKILFAIVMGTYMLPSAVTYVPCYILLSKINLIDNLNGLIISNLTNVFGIFLVRQSFLQVDKSVIEAAKLDGASHIKILLKIFLPLTKSTFVTLGLINFVTYYNEYMYPSLITKSPENFLVSAGLRQFFIQGGAYGIKWPQIMAASTITVLPLLILFFVFQKWFMNINNAN